jgi:ElaB/YqjD/DUF883 family membrane-anchored ribosome-binding protein
MVVTGSMEKEPERADSRAGSPAVVARVAGEVRRTDEKVVSLMRERPIATLCAAAVVGYLIGRIVTRLD